MLLPTGRILSLDPTELVEHRIIQVEGEPLWLCDKLLGLGSPLDQFRPFDLNKYTDNLTSKSNNYSPTSHHPSSSVEERIPGRCDALHRQIGRAHV